MPVNFSFKLKGPSPDQSQLGALFERLGWERLDTGSFRYPRLIDEPGEAQLEDWFNHVVPALMLFRCYVLTRHLVVEDLTLDARTSTGYRRRAEVGKPPLAAEYIKVFDQSGPGCSVDESHKEQEWLMLEDWLDAVDFPLEL
jgi:hypothetical protein